MKPRIKYPTILRFNQSKVDRTKKAFIALRKTQSQMVNLSLPGRRLEVSDEIAKFTIFIPNSWFKRKGLLDASRTAFLGSGLFWA